MHVYTVGWPDREPHAAGHGPAQGRRSDRTYSVGRDTASTCVYIRHTIYILITLYYFCPICILFKLYTHVDYTY